MRYDVTRETKIGDLLNEGKAQVLGIFIDNSKGQWFNTKWFKIIDIETKQHWFYFNGNAQ